LRRTAIGRESDMKLITWSMQWGRGVDLDRIVAHAQRFSDFDVLCGGPLWVVNGHLARRATADIRVRRL